MSRPAARRVAPWLFGVSLLACTPADDAPEPASSSAPEVGPPPEDTARPPSADSATTVAAPGPGPEPAGDDAGEVEPVVEGPPQAPADYGVFKFSAPPAGDDALVLHGAAGYEVVAVYAEPNSDSTRLGFLRIGARMRVGEKVKTADCSKGWHALEGGGYACASKGLMVDAKPPFMSYEPGPPRKDEPFPYDWAYVRQWNSPMWWKVPSGEQIKASYEKRAILESERTGEPLPGTEPAPAPAALSGDGGGGSGEGGDPLPAPDGELPAVDPSPAVDPAPEPTPAPAVDPPPADDPPEDEIEEEPINIPFSPKPWLEKGYFLSLGESIKEDGKGYWRTARGGVVEKKNAYGYEPKDYVGAELSPDMSFPVGFVMVKSGTRLMTLDKDDKLQATGKNRDKRTFLDLGEEVEINGRAYFTVIEHPAPSEGEGEPAGEAVAPSDEGPALFVKADVMRRPELQPIPEGLEPWDRWIDVDITKQMLVAYEGARPVYVTLVSTGKKGTDEEPFETPTGRFRIRSKQLTSNMDGATATDGNYAIQDVPWVMYFEGSYALHGAFWHRSFGSTRSHGCVNLGPSDARWLFYWTTPFVPDSWHGATSNDDNPGTTIVIRRS